METTADSTDGTAEELAALRAENEALRAELEATRPKGPLWRRVLAMVAAVLAIVAFVAAVDAVWVKSTLSDEDRFVSTLQPLPKDEAVATALSTRIGERVVEAAGIEDWLDETLPSGLGFIAAPLTGSVQGLVVDAADRVVRSDAVTTAWTATLRVTHRAVGAVLSGNDRALQAEGGHVAIDLNAIGGAVVDEVEARGFDLPDVDADLGQIVLYESDQLAEAQATAQTLDTLGWFLPLIALVLLAIAVFVATDRRRMVGFLGFGVAIGLLLHLAALRISEKAVLGTVDDEVRRAGAEAVWDTVTIRLRQGMWALIVAAVIVGIIAWVLGPSRRAAGMRSWGGSTMDKWRGPGSEEPSAFTRFIIEWKRAIQWILVVLGLLFLVFGPDPTGLLVIVTTVVVVLLVFLVEILAGPTRPAPQLEDRG